MSVENTGSEEYIRAVSKPEADQSRFPKMTNKEFREYRKNSLYPPTDFELLIMSLEEINEKIQAINNTLRENLK